MQDNGPGIVKKQIPLIFGKLLYGIKFHRLRMSRGQQGIGICAAGMYGVLTTGKPVKIISQDLAEEARALLRDPDRHQEERARDPQRQGRRGRYPAGEKAPSMIAKHGIEWVSTTRRGRQAQLESQRHARDDRAGRALSFAAAAAWMNTWSKRRSPTRTSRCTTSIPKKRDGHSSARPTELPPEPKEIKPHPYGIELGRLVTMLKDTKAGTLSAFLTGSFSRVSSGVGAQDLRRRPS